MDQETEKIIKENLRLARENNQLLKKLVSAHRRARAWAIIKMLFTIALLFGAYYLIAPLIDNLTDAYTGFMEQIQKVGEVRNNLPF